MARRIAIHVLDGDHTRRAQIARFAFELGHHAEVYADSRELAAHAPEDGVVVALEDAVEGGITGLLGLLNREGRWLAVIATSPDPTIAKAVSAIREGALDYLPLPLDPERLGRAIDGVAAAAQGQHSRRTRQALARAALERLSGREGQVLDLMARGQSNKEIGRLIGISPRTVEIHRKNALAKIGARHTADAVRLRLEAGEPGEAV